ncbi:MAG TPA: amidohydrolase family protein [Gaiellaceae bacterium]|nr:amidohydrolase family protein [Gaiellaceae bacterium]
MPTYDLHQHLWPGPLVEALSARTSPPCLRDGMLLIEPEGAFEIDPAVYGLEACIAGLDRAGIDVAVVSCPPTLGIERLPDEEAEPLRQAYHDGARAAIEASGGRVLALSMARPLDGFVGTMLAADDLADLERIAPALDEAAGRGTFVFVHPGCPARPPAGAPAWWAPVVDYTAQMQRAYGAWLVRGSDRWPDLRVVFAILAGGAPFQLERMQARGFDIGGSLRPTIYLDTASYGRRALELCLATFGARQIVFGSDAPVIDAALTLDHVRSFGQAAAKAVCSDTPTALLA